jgi:uncharacterized protein (TIGR03437 family)
MKYGIITIRSLVLFLATLASCFGQRTYTATPIQISGYDYSDLIWIGDDGKTGFGSGTQSNPYVQQCFTYQSGTVTTIATPGMLCGAVAANAGAYVFVVTPPNQPFPAPQQFYAYRNGQFSVLLPPDQTSMIAYLGPIGVNPAGQIAATLACFPPPAPGPIPATVLGTLCAYSISTTGVFARLPDQGNNARATAINANGDVAGLLTPPGLTTSVNGTNATRTGSLVVWTQSGGFKNVSTLTGNSQLGIPAGMNSKGQIIGPGYIYDGASTIVPIQMTSASSTSPVAINEGGEVVGTYQPQTPNGLQHAFYYANGTAVDLNALVTDLPSNKLLINVWSINNAGQILVTAVDVAQPAAVVANGAAYTQYLLTPASASLTAPIISSVINGATLAAGTSNSTWITILGVNLSSTTRPWANSDFVNGKLPTSLDGVSVTINGVPAYISYISPTQINLLAPDDTADGPVPVQVTNSGVKSNSFTVIKSDPMPGFFTAATRPGNPDFGIPSGFFVAAQHADGTPIGPVGLIAGANFSPARQGETIQLFGTGFGATTPPATSGQVLSAPVTLANPVTVKIGGLPAQVIYAGMTANGLDQLDVIVPNVFPDGDTAIQAMLNGVTTQANVFLTVKF